MNEPLVKVMDTKLKVYIEPPEHGWTSIKLFAGENEYSLFPSDVPYDSIHGLITALLSLSNGCNGEFIVYWNEEPAEREFIFAAKNGHIDFKVRLIEDVSFKIQREDVFSYEGSIEEVVRPFWRALRVMESKQSREEYEKHWSYPFPEREMLELTKNLKNQN